MTTTIIEVILQAIKLVLYLILKGMSSSAEENRKLADRLKLVSQLLKEAMGSTNDTVNEQDFIENLEWEQKKRYETYRDICLKVLNSGGSFLDLEKQTMMGMGERVTKNKDEILKILEKMLLDKETKAILIAKQLAL